MRARVLCHVDFAIPKQQPGPVVFSYSNFFLPGNATKVFRSALSELKKKGKEKGRKRQAYHSTAQTHNRDKKCNRTMFLCSADKAGRHSQCTQEDKLKFDPRVAGSVRRVSRNYLIKLVLAAASEESFQQQMIKGM